MKTLIINVQDGTERTLTIANAIKEFKVIREQIKEYQKKEKELKELLKSLEFTNIIIADNDKTSTFKITKKTQNRSEFTIDALQVCFEQLLEELTDLTKKEIKGLVKETLDKAKTPKQVETINFSFKE